MKNRLIKHLALFMCLPMLLAACPAEILAASRNSIIGQGFTRTKAREDAVTSSASAIPGYLSLVPETAVRDNASVIITVVNGHFDFDKYDEKDYTYYSCQGKSYDQIHNDYSNGLSLMLCLRVALSLESDYFYELPYRYNMSGEDSHRREVMLFPIYDELCAEAGEICVPRPRYNIPLPVVSEGNGNIIISVDGNGSGISSGKYVLKAASPKSYKYDLLVSGAAVDSGDYITDIPKDKSIVISDTPYTADEANRLQLPAIAAECAVDYYKIASGAAEGTVVLEAWHTDVTPSELTLSRRTETVTDFPIGTAYSDCSFARADISTTSNAYNPVYIKYMPENGVEKDTVLTLALDEKTRFDTEAFPAPQYQRGLTYEEAEDLCASGASLKELAEKLGCGGNRCNMPYRVTDVTASSMSFELLPVSGDMYDVTKPEAIRPVYTLPVHAMAVTSGAAIVTVTDSRGKIKESFTFADIMPKGREYYASDLRPEDVITSGDVIIAGSVENYADVYVEDSLYNLMTVRNGSKAFVPSKSGVKDSGLYTVERADFNNSEIFLKSQEGERVYLTFGDADSDNILSAADCSFVLQKVLDGSFTMPAENLTEDYMLFVDLDCDDILTANDSAEILSAVLGV